MRLDFHLKIIGSATQAHRCPESRRHEALVANHPGPSQSKVQRPLLPAANLSCCLTTPTSGRQSALDTEPNHLGVICESICTFRPATSAANRLSWLLTQSTSLKYDQTTLSYARRLRWSQCSGRPATNVESASLRTRAAWKPRACSDRADESFSY